MEVAIPVQGMDFDFNKGRSSPYLSVPSTPKRIGEYFFSAPTSPTHVSEFYREFNEFCMINDSSRSNTNGSSAIPFDWEEKPGTPKSSKAIASTNNEDDFAFDFSEELEKASLSADELFDGGKIRPLKPPPRLQFDDYIDQRSPFLLSPSPRSPRSTISQGKKIIRDAFSPRKKKDFDPFATAVENTRNRPDYERGRERIQDSSSNSSRRSARSLSPFRVSDYPWEEEGKQQQQQQQQQNTTTQSPLNSKPSLSSTSSKGSSRKWRLKDFLLFRSASEGRATDKDPFRKYAALFKKPEDVKNASFQSIDSSGSGSRSKRRGPISAHELHYTTNKAVSEDLKKKTFLPYKQGILGRLAFNPAVHALANGFGSIGRS